MWILSDGTALPSSRLFSFALVDVSALLALSCFSFAFTLLLFPFLPTIVKRITLGGGASR